MSAALEQPAPPVPAPREAPCPSEWDTLTLLLLAAAVLVLLALGRPVLAAWVSTYVQPESDYGYGPLVPLLVGLMLWHRRAALRAAGARPCFGALLALLAVGGLLVVTEKRSLASPQSAALLATAWSGCWLVLGTRWVRAAAFPLLFLAWMAPLPGPLLHDSTWGMQQLCTVMADRTLHLLTFPTTLSGNVITMDTFILFVDVPCSGMRLLLTMLMFGAAFAWLTDAPPWRRFGLFLFSLPLSLAVNVGRIALLGVLGECFGAHVEHTFHDSSGLMTVAAGLVVLFWAARRIGCRTFAGWPLF